MWCSEIDTNPACVSRKHFPNTIQLGDITKIDADTLEPVDIVCAGSPCQDLSVAGKRAGLEGERSGLFRTAIDIVHRLRERTGKPRFFVWENVPGAFSSNHGEDFKAVLEEIGQASIPMPPNGKWANAGMVELQTCHIEWRVLDAQYWGVPQRRKRIFLVADFAATKRGGREILFESQSVSGNTSQSRSEGQSPAGETGDSAERTTGTDVMAFNTTQITSPYNGNKVDWNRPCHTLNATDHPPAVGIRNEEPVGFDSYNNSVTGNVMPTLTAYGQTRSNGARAFETTSEIQPHADGRLL